MNDNEERTPAGIAEAISIFADTLLPGDDVFPSATSVGAHGVLTNRLRERAGPDAPAMLAAAFAERGGLDRPTDAVAAIEAEIPRFFDLAIEALYYAYYESPGVIAAIRSLGIDYNDAPQPKGYAMRPFDPAIDLPAVRRGQFVSTGEVRRVDLSRIELTGGGSK